MRISDYLSKEQKQQLNNIAKAEVLHQPKSKKKHGKKAEKVNWKELMGMSRPTYKKVSGKIKQK